jgi:hypothetical protein
VLHTSAHTPLVLFHSQHKAYTNDPATLITPYHTAQHPVLYRHNAHTRWPSLHATQCTSGAVLMTSSPTKGAKLFKDIFIYMIFKEKIFFNWNLVY